MSLVLSGALPIAQATPNFGSPLFSDAWERADLPVEQGVAGGRSWTWGPNVYGPSTIQEVYTEAPDGLRTVQYFDKARMEVRYPGGNRANQPILTTGLLVTELVTGQRQDGDNTFTSFKPAEISVAGDPVEANPTSPVYASFKSILSNGSFDRTNTVLRDQISREGIVSTFIPAVEVKNSYYEPATRHNIASVFVDFENKVGPIWNGSSYVTGRIYTDNPTANVFGYPLTEPYWSKTKVGGVDKDVLIQLFQRRVLTYTPSNQPAFQIEMGNLGQHYHLWRYTLNNNPLPTSPTPAPVTVRPSPTPPPAVTPTPTVSPPVSAPTFTINGGGNTNSQSFELSGGSARIKTIYNASTRGLFTAQIAYANDPTLIVGVVAIAAGGYSGSRYIKIPQASKYIMTVKSTGSWSFEITDFATLQNESAQSAGSFNGKGDTAMPKIRLDRGNYRVRGTQYGGADFNVLLINSQGNYETLIFGEIGPFDKTVSLQINETGDYYIDINTEGSWSLDFTK